MTIRDQKILATLEEYYGCDAYEGVMTGIAVEYPYGSRLDSGDCEDGVVYYADCGQIIQSSINDDYEAREFLQLAKNQPDWGDCAGCGCEISEVGANPISVIWRGQEQWLHLCSSECLLKFAGRRDPETLRKEVVFMAERVASLQEFLKTEISPE